MADFPAFGKIGKQFFDKVLYPHLGASRPEVLIGPRHGCDNAVIQLNHDQVVVATTDPLTIIPALGIEDSAWLTVHLIASDLATSGIAPQYALFDLNLPMEISREDFEQYWKAIHDECSRLGIAIVAGHTGKFFGCNYTIVGGGMMFAIGKKDSYVAPTMAQPGDQVIVTKGAAIGATGILARVFPETITENCGADIQKLGAMQFKNYSVVKDALTAAAVGVRDNGVTAMHDATEGGVLGAIHEFAAAADCGIRVRLPSIPVAQETKQICELFNLDPYISLSEGSLLIAVRPMKADTLIEALRREDIAAANIGEFIPLGEGRWIETDHGTQPLEAVEIDPYWQAYAEAMKKGWR